MIIFNSACLDSSKELSSIFRIGILSLYISNSLIGEPFIGEPFTIEHFTVSIFML